jgi:hypothetical protein
MAVTHNIPLMRSPTGNAVQRPQRSRSAGPSLIWTRSASSTFVPPRTRGAVYRLLWDRMAASDVYRPMMKPLPRCVRLEYSGYLHLDIVPHRPWGGARNVDHTRRRQQPLEPNRGGACGLPGAAEHVRDAIPQAPTRPGPVLLELRVAPLGDHEWLEPSADGGNVQVYSMP